MNEKNMINALVCDLISKVTFDCDLFWNNQISSAEFTKRSKEYSKEFTDSFASLITTDAVNESLKKRKRE